jgi:tetratricopeptide (TPR) repeat protein
MKLDGTRSGLTWASACLVVLVLLAGCGQRTKAAHNRALTPPPEQTTLDDLRTHAKDIKHEGVVNKELVRFLMGQRMYVLALHHIENLPKKEREAPQLLFLKGFALREVGHYDEAVEVLKAAINSNRDHAEAWNALGMTYDLMRKPEEAEQAYLGAIRINPSSPKYLNNLGFSHFSRGNYNPAIELYQKSLASDPHNVQIHNNLGFAYGMLGRYPEAISEFKQAGNEEVVYNNLGFLYYMLGLNDEAKVMYAKALEINPRFGKARKNLRLLEGGGALDAGSLGGYIPEPKLKGPIRP